jgi:hypothetical protein
MRVFDPAILCDRNHCCEGLSCAPLIREECAMKAYTLLALSVIAMGLAACAPAGPKGLSAAAMPLSADRARVYVYRDLNPYDTTQWTAVSLNGVKIGNNAPGTVFYRDVLPGTYEIEVRSDLPYPNQFKTVTLAPGSTVFAKIQQVRHWGTTFGGGGETFVVTIVDPATGHREIGGLLWQETLW